MTDTPTAQVLAEQTASRVASYPFDLDSADLTLRSSDGVEFQVHKAVLAIASPVFCTMLQLPQPATTHDEIAANAPPRPVVDLPEDHTVLDALLRLCYPVAKVELEDFNVAFSIFRAAKKYEMDWPTAYLTRELEKAVVNCTFTTPLRMWAAACRCGFEMFARKAAYSLIPSDNSTLDPDLAKLIDAEGSQVLEGISVGEYLQLKEFLSKKGQVDPDFRFLERRTVCIVGGATPEAQVLFTSDIPYPDIICRSSDGAEFPVHGAILALHSDTLKRRFNSDACPEGAGAHESAGSAGPEPGLPSMRGSFPALLSFDTDAQVLSLLLSICYGDKARPVLDFPLLARAISVAERYCMERPHTVVEELWDELARSRPLDAYFSAVEHGLTPRVLAAAKHVLSKGPLEQQRTSSTDHMPALPYHRLSVYVAACETVVCRELSAARSSWLASSAYDGHSYSYSTGTKMGIAYISHTYTQDWLCRHFDTLQQEVFVYGPGRNLDALLGPLSLVRKGASGYAYCTKANQVISEVLKIGDTLSRKIGAAIDEMTLEVLW
ncbi:hypothetical protein GY45DRAFT_184453 [Cubamyces sp. BRFM 1775]|nr:hypothetical protein GY45DRAFT_184453 [Cubamyces sp. BRFM 1775]